MSTLRCTNLQDTSGSNSLTTAQIYNGAAKAWVNFNGTGTVAIRAQFNVSSITDNGVGNYTVNFTTAMQDADYAPVGFCHRQSNVINHIDLLTTKTASQYRFSTSQTTNGAVVGLSSVDVSQCYLAFFR